MEITAPRMCLNSRVALKIHPTGFRFDFKDNYTELITALIRDENRNEIIVQDILQAASEEQGQVIVVSERIGHLLHLKELILRSYFPAVEVVTSQTSKKEYELIVTRYKKRKVRVLLTTLKTMQSMKGVFCTALVLATLCRYDNSLIMAIGRLEERGEYEPQSIVFDYSDEPGVLKSSLKERVKGYRRLGFGTMVPASPYFVQ